MDCRILCKSRDFLSSQFWRIKLVATVMTQLCYNSYGNCHWNSRTYWKQRGLGSIQIRVNTHNNILLRTESASYKHYFNLFDSVTSSDLRLRSLVMCCLLRVSQTFDIATLDRTTKTWKFRGKSYPTLVGMGRKGRR